ncbi:MAG: pyridoxal 5'-phosphate synthase glutaminase subunit PdxT [bacterium]|nr:pyridoxal 5'-phosphate synthase glutaminase subunit PdxT [bacterium]
MPPRWPRFRPGSVKRWSGSTSTLSLRRIGCRTGATDASCVGPPVKIGALALQGDFREHLATLRRLGVEGAEVRTPEELAAVDALIIPGGESTTIGKLAHIYGLIEPIRECVRAGMPVLGTCAGMIFLASGTTDGDQDQLHLLDVVVERNAFGRQVDSFEADMQVAGRAEPVHAVFIRAPWIHKAGADVEILAAVVDPSSGEERPVVVRQGNILATSFHPELTSETWVHELLVAAATDHSQPS